MANNAFANIKFEFFFDKPGIDKAVAKSEKAALSKFGSFTRQRAKQSIRSKKKVTPGGQNKPPSSHEGSFKRLIFFAFDPQRESVVIGPLTYKKGEAPALLEYGGTVQRDGKTYHYGGNPTMVPAFDYVYEHNWPSIFADSIK